MPDFLACGLRRGLLLAGLSMALTGPVAAQAPKSPANPVATQTRSTHDDWVVRCAGDAGCEAVQSLESKDGKGTLAHVAVRPEKDIVRLIVQVPPGVWLPANVVLRVGGKDVTLSYKRCGQTCIASVELPTAEAKAIAELPGAELVYENGSRQQFVLPISFKGLPAAFAAAR